MHQKEVVMNMKVVIGMFFLVFFSCFANADFPVKHYYEFKKVDKFEDYLIGLGRGIFWTNTVLEVSKQKRIFCMPGGLALDQGIILSVIDQEVRNPTGRDSWKPDTTIELIAVLAFKNKFPCSGT